MITNIEQQNQVLISKIFVAQCNQDFELATSLLQQLQQSITSSISMFDKHGKMQKILQDNFEILPQSNLEAPQILVAAEEGTDNYQKFFEQIYNKSNQEEEKKIKKNPWSEEEKKLFQQALKQCKAKDWKAIAAFIKSRSPQQVRSFYQKYEKRKYHKQYKRCRVKSDQ